MTHPNKKVFLYCIDPSIHFAHKSIIKSPPEGYEFLEIPQKLRDSVLTYSRNSPLIKKIYNVFLKPIIKNTNLFEKLYSKKIPKNTDLVYATSRIPYQTKKPYILDLIDTPTSIIGYNYKKFTEKKDKIEKELSSNLCKKIIVWNPFFKEVLKENFSKKVSDKIEYVKLGVEQKDVNKKQGKKDKIKILFIGSASNPLDFDIKGGVIAIEAFKKIEKKFGKRVEFTIRCEVPSWIKKEYNSKNIKFIEERIPFEDLIKLYVDSDILLLPGHDANAMVPIEAMSYGLPVIALDVPGMNAVVRNGINGYCIKKSEKLPYNVPEYPTNLRDKRFTGKHQIDERVTKDIFNCIKRIIEDEKLMEKLSEGALKTIKEEFNIKNRNKKLKEIFDEALS